MKKDALGLLILSMILNGMQMSVITDQARQLKKYRDHTRRMMSWIEILGRMVKENKAGFDVPQKVMDDMEAYVILLQNDMA